jgi:hypothetical protein
VGRVFKCRACDEMLSKLDGLFQMQRSKEEAVSNYLYKIGSCMQNCHVMSCMHWSGLSYLLASGLSCVE